MTGRTTSILSNNNLLEQLRRTQVDLDNQQRQISTGLKYDAPSDAPGDAAAILLLRQRLLERDQQLSNLAQGNTLLNTADQALKDFKDITLEAQVIAQEAANELGGTSAEARAAQALVISEQLDALLGIANREILGVPLFGSNQYGASAAPFEEFLGGVRYRGGDTNLRLNTGQQDLTDIASNGADAFGALTTRVRGNADLDPDVSAQTRLSDLEGARGRGVQLGQVRLTVGAATAVIDLSGAETVQDVVTRLSAGFDGLAPGAAALTLTADGFALQATGPDPVAVADLQNGSIAADLGIAIANAGGPATAGGDVGPRLTKATRIADLGPAIDLASGLVITQGPRSETVNLTGVETIEDLQNRIRGLDLGVRLEINDAADGLDFVSEVSGVAFSVGENGGTTATDLGIRSFTTDTRLDDFRNGLGVLTNPGFDDLNQNRYEMGFQLHDGTTFEVDIDGLTTVGEVITRIETEAAAAGVAVGTDFVIGMNPVGNGIQLVDNTVGPNDFLVEDLGTQLTAEHLGIAGNAGAGATINGVDTATVRTDNVFSHLMDLRDALTADDTTGIALAMDQLNGDLDRLDASRANVATAASRNEQQTQRLEDMKLTEQILLSDLQDADLTEVITRFNQLQQQLQASLTAGSQIQQLTLLNFLR
ncbi:flagellin [Mucisphaera sp.]|uniref:flagellin n=1 Tax=Mucisphaera sp. TaxID=2913024 RepID=UPI003D116594